MDWNRKQIRKKKPKKPKAAAPTKLVRRAASRPSAGLLALRGHTITVPLEWFAAPLRKAMRAGGHGWLRARCQSGRFYTLAMRSCPCVVSRVETFAPHA